MFYSGGFVLWEVVGPQFYRKIGLNGRLLCDTEPILHKRTDAEPEQTNVDGLTLQVRHNTTDVYVPLVGSDFALQVRRNHFGSVWANGRGLASSRRPDLPFGNCWLSGIAANVHVIDRGPGHPVHVLVTDEEGTLHRFIEFFKGKEHVGYYPLPNCHSVQDGRTMALARRGNRLEFRRKYGTSLSFDLETPVVEIASDHPNSTNEEHTYYRAIRVSDRRGGYTQYHFDTGNSGLIPDEISFVNRSMTIHRNSQGLVERIVDLRGNEHRYEYRPSLFPDGSPLLVRQYRPKLDDLIPCTLYDYEEKSQSVAPDVDERHAVICLITDPLGNTYSFKHLHHFSQLGDSDVSGQESDPIPPIRISEAGLPDQLGTTKYHDYSPPPTERQPNPPRMTFVSDAERNGQLYEFIEKEEITLSDLPWYRTDSQLEVAANSPRLNFWRQQQVTYFQGDRHRYDASSGKFIPGFFTKLLLTEKYEFDPGSGPALTKAIDTEGNVTSFAYGDPLIRSHLQDLLPERFKDPLSERCMDVTTSTNPLGGTKRFAYDPVCRAIVRKEDELGHLTVFEVDGLTGLPKSETVYEDGKAEKEGLLFARTEFEYTNSTFPGFRTRKTLKRINSTAESPSWEVDLVRIYDADEHGCLFREVADPEGQNLVWTYHYDNNNNKISAHYPDGFLVQFRYDPLNRLVRVYRSNDSVQKQYYDARGNKTREVEPNGDVTEFSYDKFSRLIGKEEETGPVDKRQKKISVFQYNRVNSKVFQSVTGEPVESYKHDGAQRLIFKRIGKKDPTTYTYSANGCSNLFASSRFCAVRTLVERRSRWYYQYDGDQNLLKHAYAKFRFGAFFPWNKYLLSQTFDPAGKLIRKKDKTGLTQFEYDALNRLVVERYGNRSWKRVLRTSTGLEYGSLDSSGKRVLKRFDSAGFEVSD